MEHRAQDDGGGSAQAQHWNGAAGRAWVDAQQVLDRMFEPLERQLVEVVEAAGARRVLDVGCGTGSTTLAMARKLASQGAGGRCTGLDISAPMIAAARARAEREGSRAEFIVADAQRHAFEPASFDLIVSRFGVMFFEDPVLAFANLRRAGRDGAAMHCIAWRDAAETPFMITAERAAAPLLPNLQPRRPGAGQFAFADRLHVQRILAESGWTDIELRPLDVACTIAEAELAPYLARLGPVGQALQEADERTRVQVTATVRAAFEPFVHDGQVTFNAACWAVRARVTPAAAAVPDRPAY